MKGKFLLSLLAISAISGTALADIVINLPANSDIETINYYYAPIKQYVSAKTRAERGMVAEELNVTDNKAIINIPTQADSYMFGFDVNKNNIRLYAQPGEEIVVDVTSLNPFVYKMSGTELVDGMNQLVLIEAPIVEKVNQLQQSGNNDDEAMQALIDEYNNAQIKFIQENPESPAAALALLNLDGEDYINLYDNMPDSFTTTIVYPLAELQYKQEKKNVEMAQKQQALQSGSVDAPDFTLKDIEGKDVSLSEFKGKWVILDFWGTWCPWCIKGFPELKKAYEEYAGKLEIIGIDCRDSEEAWKAGVEKYQLPWVNVYNHDNSNVLNDYGVQGFPTKAIVNPEGKISNITVGHIPEFFTILSDLINSKN
ncbi:MAG: TlpA family protein disulfide reductase [Muribaculaceae bacterium]|nr:TlpA family protein disulfide reductase [Muribaculaceae bacterium]